MGYGLRSKKEGNFPAGNITPSTVGACVVKNIEYSNTPMARRYPMYAILHWNADVDTVEKAGFGHDFQSLVLGNQYQLQADGSTVNIGANMSVDTINGEKWLRSCGAVTNLFGGDTSQARVVSLTSGTVYTLQVFGAGMVSCSYGTATIASPLKITATATAAVTFTPSGATSWMLTATSYPVPYVPPGVTQPASNATATNGAWFKMLENSELWKALDGQPDGVELLASKDFTDFAINTEPSSFVSGGKLNLVNITSTHTVAYKALLFVVGQRYSILTVKIDSISGGVVFKGQGGTPSAHITTPGVHSVVLSSNFTGMNFEIAATGGTNAVLSEISIQRIQPQPLTLATRVMMGVGSGDLALGGAGQIVRASTSGSQQMFFERTSADESRPVRAYDGSVYATNPTPSIWSRNAIIRRVTQVNTAGTQYRAGYMIEGTHTAIQWGSWANYDGSFEPSTLYRLMLGYNNAYPMWFNKITVWKEQVDDAEIMEALS